MIHEIHICENMIVSVSNKLFHFVAFANGLLFVDSVIPDIRYSRFLPYLISVVYSVIQNILHSVCYFPALHASFLTFFISLVRPFLCLCFKLIYLQKENWPNGAMDGKGWGYDPNCVGTHHQNSHFHPPSIQHRT